MENSNQWANIPEIEPDKTDLAMLNEIDNDVNHKMFITETQLLANRQNYKVQERAKNEQPKI